MVTNGYNGLRKKFLRVMVFIGYNGLRKIDEMRLPMVIMV